MKKFGLGFVSAVLALFSLWLLVRAQQPPAPPQPTTPGVMATAQAGFVDTGRDVQDTFVETLLRAIFATGSGATPVPQDWLDPAIVTATPYLTTPTAYPDWWNDPAVEPSATPQQNADAAIAQQIANLQTNLAAAQQEYAQCIWDHALEQSVCAGKLATVNNLADGLRRLTAAAAEAQQ